MLTVLEIVVPALVIGLILLPIVNVFRGKTSARSAKIRLTTHIALFAAVVAGTLFLELQSAHAATQGAVATNTILGTNAQGMGFLAAALATGLGSLGAGIAVAAAAPAAIGAFSENGKNFGKALIFVAMGEGVAIYGLLISILIMNKL